MGVRKLKPTSAGRRFQFAFGSVRRVEHLLQTFIGVPCAALPSFRRAKHLDIGDRIEPVSFGEPL